MSSTQDGPVSQLFKPLKIHGGPTLEHLEDQGLSREMTAASSNAPSGQCVCWGIPFEIDQIVVLADKPFLLNLELVTTKWLVFMHTSDIRPLVPNSSGFYSPMRGEGQLAEHPADYVIGYEDGTEERLPVRRRFHIGAFQRRWGENCFEAVAHTKPRPVRPPHEQLKPNWGFSQTRVDAADDKPWVNWLWAWENRYPHKKIIYIRLEPVSGAILVSAISSGNVASLPTRWESRRKAVFMLPTGAVFDPELDANGLLKQIRLDLGQVISAAPRRIYPLEGWAESYNNQRPHLSKDQVLVEFTAHPQAFFHLAGGEQIPVAELEVADHNNSLQPVAPQEQRITLRVVERGSKRPVPVRLHAHGAWGEYLAPLDRHRIPNPEWFEDYSVDAIHDTYWFKNGDGRHYSAYIAGETTIDLPLGRVFLEISKGFEIRPRRLVVEVTPETLELEVEIDSELPWRQKNWVTADTHVHFLSPTSALLEGEAEGVNIINLLASQWGELMTNVGDFDGRTTWGAKEAGGNGEFLVRVGTENRQHVLGHSSLLGYSGQIIAPMTTSGPDDSALGDPLEILLTEWARMCKKQGGLVVLPHFPNPRAEAAASIVAGEIDALEMTSWGNFYRGIDP